jgi:hypothetical protein
MKLRTSAENALSSAISKREASAPFQTFTSSSTFSGRLLSHLLSDKQSVCLIYSSLVSETRVPSVQCVPFCLDTVATHTPFLVRSSSNPSMMQLRGNAILHTLKGTFSRNWTSPTAKSFQDQVCSAATSWISKSMTRATLSGCREMESTRYAAGGVEFSAHATTVLSFLATANFSSSRPKATNGSSGSAAPLLT